MNDSFIKIGKDAFLNISSIECFFIEKKQITNNTEKLVKVEILVIRTKSGHSYCVEDFEEAYKNLLEKVVYNYEE